MRARLLSVLFVCGSIACAGLVVNAQAPATAPPPGAAAGTAPAPAAPAPPTEKVKITILTVPSNSIKKVFVNWGKRKLGIIVPHHPLIVERPRDSGPLDLIISAEGYVPVQTRAYTFADTKLTVKLTPIDQKNTLLGYRTEVPPPDAGVPPSAPGIAGGAPAGGLPPTIASPPRAPDAGAR